MKTDTKRLYEAMFLVDSAQAASDWNVVITSIEKILKKAEREIVSIRKWDERKLAYEIKGHSRGTYILCYFRANGEKIQDIERDVQLSERVMRVLILSADHMAQEDIERGPISRKDSEMGTPKDSPALQAEKQGQKTAQKAAQSAQAAEKAEAESQHAGTAADVSESEQPEQAGAEDDPEPAAEQGRDKADAETSS